MSLLSGMLNPQASADAPAGINVNLIQYARNNPKWIAKLSVAVVVLCGLSGLSPWFTLGSFLCLIALGTHLYRVWQSFYYGELSAAKVVGEHPSVVAVFSDLTQGDGFYPYVKVLQRSVVGSDGKPLAVGERFAAASTYQMPLKTARWADFFPQPISWATSSPQKQQAAMDRISTEQWSMLDASVSQLQTPFESGLFSIAPEVLQAASSAAVEASSQNAEANPPLVLPSVTPKKEFPIPRPVMVGLSLLLLVGTYLFTTAIFGSRYEQAVRAGDAHVEGGQLEKAVASYTYAIQRDNQNPVAFFRRGVVYQQLGRHREAQMDFNDVVLKKPGFAPAYRLRAKSSRAQGLERKAQEDDSIADRLGAELEIADPPQIADAELWQLN